MEVNLSDVLHDLKTIVSGQIYAKQLELYMDAMDVTDEDVYCDKTRLNQVLLNLLSNAIKFTPAGGTVSVRVRQLGFILPASLPLALPAVMLQLSGWMLCFVLNWQSLPSMP